MVFENIKNLKMYNNCSESFSTDKEIFSLNDKYELKGKNKWIELGILFLIGSLFLLSTCLLYRFLSDIFASN